MSTNYHKHVTITSPKMSQTCRTHFSLQSSRAQLPLRQRSTSTATFIACKTTLPFIPVHNTRETLRSETYRLDALTFPTNPQGGFHMPPLGSVQAKPFVKRTLLAVKHDVDLLA